MNVNFTYSNTRAYISVDTIDELLELQNKTFISGEVSSTIYEVDTSNISSSPGHENSDLSIDIYGYKIMPFPANVFYEMESTNFYLKYPDATEFDSNTRFNNIPNIKLFTADKVKTIPDEEFQWCPSIKVSFKNVSKIGAGAFSRCLNINTWGVSNVQYLGDNAFANTYIDYEVEFPKLVSLSGDPFYNCKFISYIHAPKLKKVFWQEDWDEYYKLDDLGKWNYRRSHGNIRYYNPKIRLFDSCPTMKYIYFPNLSVETIGSNIFSHLLTLEELEIGALSNVADNAFSGLSDLEWVSFASKDPGYIGRNAFKNCSSLSSFSMQNIVELENDAFVGCNELKEFNCETIDNFNSEIDGDIDEWTTSMIRSYRGGIPRSIKSLDVDLNSPWLNFEDYEDSSLSNFPNLSSIYAIDLYATPEGIANAFHSIDDIISGMHPVIKTAINRNFNNTVTFEEEIPEDVPEEDLSNYVPTTITFPKINIYFKKSMYDALISVIESDDSYDITEEETEQALSILSSVAWSKTDRDTTDEDLSSDEIIEIESEDSDDDEDEREITEEEQAILDKYNKSFIKDELKAMFGSFSVTDFKHPDEEQITPSIFKYTELDYTSNATIYRSDIIEKLNGIVTIYQIDPPTEPVLGKMSIESNDTKNKYVFNQPIESFGVKGTKASIKGNVYQYCIKEEDDSEISVKTFNTSAIPLQSALTAIPMTAQMSAEINEEAIDGSMITSDNERDFLIESVVTNQNSLSAGETLAFKNYTYNASQIFTVDTKLSYNSIIVNVKLLHEGSKLNINLFKGESLIGEMTFNNVSVGTTYTKTFSGLSPNTGYRIVLALFDNNNSKIAENTIDKATTKKLVTETFSSDKTNYITGAGKKFTYEEGTTIKMPTLAVAGLKTNNGNTVFYGWTTTKNLYGKGNGKVYLPNESLQVTSNMVFYPVVTKVAYVANDIGKNISITAKKGKEGCGKSSTYTVSIGIPNKTFSVQTSVAFSKVNSKIKYFEAIVVDQNITNNKNNKYIVVKKDGTAKANTGYSKTITLTTNSKGQLSFTLHGHIGNQSNKIGDFSSVFKFKIELSKGCVASL